MKLCREQIKQLIVDYDNGNGPGNLALAKMYGVSNTYIRSILIKEQVYISQRGACTVVPDAFEVKRIREHNRVLKSTLKSIIKQIEEGASTKYIKVVAYSAIEKCGKKTGIKELTNK